MGGIFMQLKDPYNCQVCGGIGAIMSTSVTFEGSIANFRCGSCGYAWSQDQEHVNKFMSSKKAMPSGFDKKDGSVMKVEYNGFTGELVKLEQKKIGIANEIVVYDLSIEDNEKHVTHSFTGVKMEDVKFLGVVVMFGG